MPKTPGAETCIIKIINVFFVYFYEGSSVRITDDGVFIDEEKKDSLGIQFDGKEEIFIDLDAIRNTKKSNVPLNLYIMKHKDNFFKIKINFFNKWYKGTKISLEAEHDYCIDDCPINKLEEINPPPDFDLKNSTLFNKPKEINPPPDSTLKNSTLFNKPKEINPPPDSTLKNSTLFNKPKEINPPPDSTLKNSTLFNKPKEINPPPDFDLEKSTLWDGSNNNNFTNGKPNKT